MKRKEFFESVYRIWDVKPTPEDKLAFWERVNGPTCGSDLSELSGENRLELQEIFECPRYEDEDDETSDRYPDENSIYIWKYCWERGIEQSEQAMLRYFDFHHSGVLENPHEDPHVRLALYQGALVFSPY
jgi:hypothetical protein